MVADVRIDWDDRALKLYLLAVEEKVLPELASEVEDLARSIAPVRIRRTPVPRWAKRGRVGTPGKLKASVRSEVDRDYLGPYADISALWYGRFMDPPAKQIKRDIPFLPSALYWVVDGRNLYVE